ncbi:hypothetical protein [Ferrovibrio xuzhouensis]|uniref:Uncharacterized protein n=1 Tax=Ferrovibrio xuzhouensis TaxID=1576914 RepID=A0ABV7VJR6_9PROT
MRLSTLAVIAAVSFSASMLATVTMAGTQVCRQPVDGYETYTDCYGNQLSGTSLRAAQIGELVDEKKTPGEIQMALGATIVTVRSAADTCPRNTVWVGSMAVPVGTSVPLYDVQCAY